jgi:hypothetical protein
MTVLDNNCVDLVLRIGNEELTDATFFDWNKPHHICKCFGTHTCWELSHNMSCSCSNKLLNWTPTPAHVIRFLYADWGCWAGHISQANTTFVSLQAVVPDSFWWLAIDHVQQIVCVAAAVSFPPILDRDGSIIKISHKKLCQCSRIVTCDEHSGMATPHTDTSRSQRFFKSHTAIFFSPQIISCLILNKRESQ